MIKCFQKFYYLFLIDCEDYQMYKEAKFVTYSNRQNKCLLLSNSDLQYLVNDIDHQEVQRDRPSECKSRQNVLLKRKHDARKYRSRFICDKNVLENLIFRTKLFSAKIKLSTMLPCTCLICMPRRITHLLAPSMSPTVVSKSTFSLK